MKAKYLFISLIAALAAVSCEETTPAVATLTVKTRNVEFTAAAGSFDLSVESNVKWDAEVSEGTREGDDVATGPEVIAPAPWISLEKGKDVLTISVTANTTLDEREGMVIITAGDKTTQVTVTQEGSALEMTATPAEISATIAGKNASIALTSNVAWRAEVSAAWLEIAPAKGDAGTQNIAVTIPEYTGFEARTATVDFFYGLHKCTSVTVSQEAFIVAMNVSDESIEATTDAGSKVITVTSNYAWTVASSANWVTVSPAEGEAAATAQNITVSWEEAGGSEREATVTVTAGNVTKTVAIHQAKAEAKPILVDLVFATVNADGASGTSYKILTPALVTSAASSYDLGVKTYTLNNYSGYSIEIYSSYSGSLLNTKAGLITLPAIVSGKTTKAIRPTEGFGFIKFPALADYKLSKVSIVTSPLATSTQKFPVYITPTYGNSNEEAINAALASNEDIGRKGKDNPTVLNLTSPVANTAYYLFMPQVSGSNSSYQYQIMEIHLEYQPQ